MQRGLYENHSAPYLPGSKNQTKPTDMQFWQVDGRVWIFSLVVKIITFNT
jgi:hypothetical protein